MKSGGGQLILRLAVLIVGLAAPFLLPAYQTQLAMLWLMVVFALTWDVTGGQMGYNSFGNIVFFGVGMYACAVTQVGLYYDVAAFNEASSTVAVGLTVAQYFTGLSLGLAFAAVAAVVVAATIGPAILALRGHYFAIGTLGLGIAAGEIAGGWELIGAGRGMVTPLFPDEAGSRTLFFYFLFFALAVLTFSFLRWLYTTRFGLALNAIRDDEDKAEAMGLRTTRYKTIAWCVSAVFLGVAGGGLGNLVGFIDPSDVAFAGPTFGVWMVLMAILGGRGTIWGPVIGAVIFHIMQELFWTYLLGWQRVAFGVLVVVIVVFFQQGIMGWARARWPHRFGHQVEDAT